jgi:hypothetical protein
VLCTTQREHVGPGDTEPEKFLNGLNEMGQDGWELCGMNGFQMIFKRPLPPTSDFEEFKKQTEKDNHGKI